MEINLLLDYYEILRLVIIFKKQLINMDFFLVLKILFVIGVMIAIYAIIRNLDIIKIILIYFKDKLLGK